MEIMKQYVTFVTNWSESEKTFKRCQRENPRFCELLKELGENGRFGDARDLFIRPIQRLPSISLLLKEIKRNARSDTKDMKYIDDAIQSIGDVLEIMNQDLAKIQKQQQLFVVYKEIENCPPDLITSRRDFIEQFVVKEITSKENTLGVRLIIFLFSDVIEVAKVKSKSKYREFCKHCYNMENNLEKPFKHVAMIPLSAISHVLQFDEDLDCSRKLFGFNIKNENRSKTVNCFQYLDSQLGFEDMLHLMAKQLKRNQTSTSKKEEDFILWSLPSRRISIDPIYHTKPTNKSKRDVKNLAVKAINSILMKKKTKRRSASCSDIQGSSISL